MYTMALRTGGNVLSVKPQSRFRSPEFSACAYDLTMSNMEKAHNLLLM